MRLIAIAVLLVIAAGCCFGLRPCTPEALRLGQASEGIPNFDVVDAKRGVYRGGQPTTNGLKWLVAHGFKYIVKLNTESEGPGWDSGPAWAMGTSGGKMTEGFATARTTDFSDCGVSFLPISIEEQLLKVPNWKVRHAVNQAFCFNLTPRTDPWYGPGKVLIHCEHGQDRTGLVVACYRVQHMGWTHEAAEKDMLAHGFHKALHGLWEYWESFKPQVGTHIDP